MGGCRLKNPHALSDGALHRYAALPCCEEVARHANERKQVSCDLPTDHAGTGLHALVGQGS